MNAVSPLHERTQETAEERWARMPYIKNGDDYLASLRNRGTKLFLFGEKIDEPADHPMITPSINALRATYDLPEDEPELATAHSSLIDDRVNRFLHIVESPDDLVMKHKMQRRLGQITGTCFQRCTGLDTISVMHSITYEIDDKYGSNYHANFLEFLKEAQRRNVLIAVGMTDPKGDRSKRPHEQEDPDQTGEAPGRPAGEAAAGSPDRSTVEDTVRLAQMVGAVEDADRVLARDVSEGMMEEGRRKAEERGLDDVEFAYGEFRDPELEPNQRVDIVTSNFALHHLADDEKREAIGVMAETGARRIVLGDVAFFEDPDPDAPFYSPEVDDPATVGTLVEALTDEGFAVTAVERVHDQVAVIVAERLRELSA